MVPWPRPASRRVWPLCRKKLNANAGERLWPSSIANCTNCTKKKLYIYIYHEFALRYLQPTIFISPCATWSQCSSTSRFSAELFGCIADCKACIAKKLRKQLGESFCLTPAQSAWRDSLNSIFLSPMSVEKTSTRMIDVASAPPETSLSKALSVLKYGMSKLPSFSSAFLQFSPFIFLVRVAWGHIKSSCSSGLSQSDIRKNWWTTSPRPCLIFAVSDLQSLGKSWGYQLMQMWICGVFENASWLSFIVLGSELVHKKFNHWWGNDRNISLISHLSVCMFLPKLLLQPSGSERRAEIAVKLRCEPTVMMWETLHPSLNISRIQLSVKS